MRPQTIVERLDFVAKRVQGLKFTPPTQLKPGEEPSYGCFMSCDMYYIEIKVDQSHQSVKDVIISHGNSADGISCPVLRKVLADQDFETFAKHLTGLHSIYQINTNDKTVKQRAYPALTALEADLTTLYDYQRRIVGNLHDLVHKSPIGFMEPRKGGLPVRLTYFITPYDLVDTTQKSFIALNVNNIIDKNLGLSAAVEIEGSSLHKIQIKSLMEQNSNRPKYAAFNSLNSEKLPAQFVLKLSQPFPMLNTSITQIINEINEPATIREYLRSIMTNSRESIISLIARQELDLNKGPFCRTVDTLKGADSELCDLKKHVYSIRLPDQNHTYHILDNYLERPDGVYVTKIPFTHPTSIPSILKVLRQQALFNFVIGSCIRRNKSTPSNPANNPDENSSASSSQMTNIFDVLPVSLNSVCVSFEHPSKESLATLELDIKEISCQLYALDKESVCSDEFAAKVLQKCWSIPVTLRSVLKKCNERRLALLEDSNKRRERELQELLANNPTTQQGLQVKSNLKQEATPQSKYNVSNEKSTNRDLNSIAEFLSSRVNNANTSDNSRQNDANFDNSSNRTTNLLKKFSCKPKVKQNTTATKSQSGNKILSQMLKRQNSSISIDDPLLRGPLTKKVKTKNISGESSTSADQGPPTPSLTTTKLISPEVANAARFVSKQAKQTAKNQTISLSLIRSPTKAQSASISSSTQLGLALMPNQKQSNPTNTKFKMHANGGNDADLDTNGKPRKSSINAVIDRLVCEVNPEQQNLMTQMGSSITSTDSANRNADSSKLTPNGPKSKNRTPGGDQFAIKQGSSGGGLKLTVTKTKPVSIVPSSSTSSGAASAGAQSSTTTNATTSSNASSAVASASTSTSTSLTSNASSSSSNNVNSKQSEANKIVDLGSATPSIRYTIPKISKTQQASQSSSSNANSSDNATNSNDTSNQQADDSNNPSSSGNSTSAAPSSTTTKRTTSNPFNRNGNSNRNPVSSSTHPPNNRTTSNPLANAMGRPSSTSNVDNHISNRISSSSTTTPTNTSGSNGQMIQNNSNLRPAPALIRSINLLPLMPQPTGGGVLAGQGQYNLPQRFLNASALMQQQQQQQPCQTSLPMMGQPLPQQMLSIRMPQQAGVFSNQNDLNLIANQVALLNQQQQQKQQQLQQQQIQQQQQQQQQIPQQPPLNPSHIQMVLKNQQANVSSSSDTSQNEKPATNSKPETTSSTPSSPTECNQVETIAPPPLIPIEALHEARPASPDEEHDDESDRLSIVDMAEFADAASATGAPKPSDGSSPMEGVQHGSNCTASSSLTLPQPPPPPAPAPIPTNPEPSAPASTSASPPAATPINTSPIAPAPFNPPASIDSGAASIEEVAMDADVVVESASAPSQQASQPPLSSNLSVDNNSMATTQSPQSTVAAATTNN